MVNSLSTTDDAFLGGRLTLRQPKAGHHRAGLDAVVLAATLPDNATGKIADLGAGVGCVGLCALARLPDVTATLVEREPDLVALARQNALAFADRAAVIAADLLAPASEREAAGLTPAGFDHVLANPPFHPAGRTRASPHGARAAAHLIGPRDHDGWVRAAVHLSRGSATLTLIVRADDVAAWLAALTGRYGDLRLAPLYPRAGASASRLLIRGTLGAKKPLALLPGTVLHDEDGAVTPLIAGALRDGRSLAALFDG